MDRDEFIIATAIIGYNAPSGIRGIFLEGKGLPNLILPASNSLIGKIGIKVIIGDVEYKSYAIALKNIT